MIIKLEGCLIPQCAGRDHLWEFQRFTLKEIEAVQETVGVEPNEFVEALDHGGMSLVALRAMRTLIMIMHRRDGVVVPYDDVDAEINSLSFITDPEPEPEEKPTEPETTSPHPEAGADSTSTFGPAPAEASEPSSSATAPTCGGGTGSP